MKLPDTGQTGNFTSTPGEDSDTTINPPSYKDNGNGTITDNVTGLMWQQLDSGEIDFKNAAAYCTALRIGGYSDWRLPTAYEIFNINYFDTSHPALHPLFLVNKTPLVQTNPPYTDATYISGAYWWSSDSGASDTSSANATEWSSNAGGGIGNHLQNQLLDTGKGGKPTFFNARCVRNITTPVPLPAFRYIDNGDGTTTDNYTGLVWKKTKSPTSYTWEGALAYVNSLNASGGFAGKSDWRLPNIRELFSLVDVKRFGPTLNTSAFTNLSDLPSYSTKTPGSTGSVGTFWSSTTQSADGTIAWDLHDIYNGLVSYTAKTSLEYVLVVRGPVSTGSGSSSSSSSSATGYTIGGSGTNAISGLTSGSLQLSLNGSETITINSGATSFAFTTRLANGATYAVTKVSDPSNLVCALSNATGTISSNNILNIQVSCAPFSPNIVLGGPTASSIVMNVYSATQGGSVTVSYGTSSGNYTRTSSASTLVADTALTIALSGLSSNTQYYYRVNLMSGTNVAAQSPEYRFRTARPKGSTFTFAIQADSHLDFLSDPDLFRQTLRNILTDAPDFLIDLGDTFMTEKWVTALDTINTSSPFNPATNQADVLARYKYELPYLGLVANSVPLFLVNGNHEGEAGYIANQSPNNTKPPPYTLPLWATSARRSYFASDLTNGSGFYSGDTSIDPVLNQQRGAYYSWEWGDALFVVLDPYWNSAKATNETNTAWNMSLGKAQYDWLTNVLSTTTAKYKFIFTHNLVGGNPTSGKEAIVPDPTSPGGLMRGGAEAAKYFEWGGKNSDLTDGFFTNGTNNHTGWAKPIHQLLVEKRVTAVFHGHDHLYAKQVLDGIIYQEVPQPSAKDTNSSFTAGNAKQGGYISPGLYGTVIRDNSGHLRVTVTPNGVTTEYVRSWLPTCTNPSFTQSCETAGHVNREIADSWTIQ